MDIGLKLYLYRVPIWCPGVLQLELIQLSIKGIWLNKLRDILMVEFSL